MKALIFAAGKGTRLKPLTDTRPKALVEVDGRTLLEWAIVRLRNSGADELVCNVHHFGEQIIQFLHTHDFKVPVGISDERLMLLDTGGGLRQAASLFSHLDEPLLIHNVDILSNARLDAFYKAPLQGAVASLLVSRREASRYLYFDEQMRLRAWQNARTGEVRSPLASVDLSALQRYAFSGIHLYSHRHLDLLDSQPEAFPIMDFYLKICADYDVRGFVQDDLRLLDVGKPETLEQAPQFISQLAEYRL
ncbi:MAG: NTP transferase domain-containing protein [Alloprevotella sp.]|nr:NTP transferase domain-containing protein [Alloprevotella sp.]